MLLPTKAGSILVLLLLAVTLSACGFHLRGKIDLPPELARIQVSGLNQNNALRRQLERLLEANGVEVVTENGPGIAQLRLGNYRQDKEILVVGNDGRVREYRLLSGIDASLTSEAFEMPSTPFTVFRDFNYDPDDVLGKAEEERQLREDMETELSQLIIQRLGALIRQ